MFLLLANKALRGYNIWKWKQIYFCIIDIRTYALYLTRGRGKNNSCHLSLGIFDTFETIAVFLLLVRLPAGQKNHWSESYMSYQHRLSNGLHPKLVFNPISGEPDQTDPGQTPTTNRHAVCWLPFTPTVLGSDVFYSILFYSVFAKVPVYKRDHFFIFSESHQLCSSFGLSSSRPACHAGNFLQVSFPHSQYLH